MLRCLKSQRSLEARPHGSGFGEGGRERESDPPPLNRIGLSPEQIRLRMIVERVSASLTFPVAAYEQAGRRDLYAPLKRVQPQKAIRFSATVFALEGCSSFISSRQPMADRYMCSKPCLGGLLGSSSIGLHFNFNSWPRIPDSLCDKRSSLSWPQTLNEKKLNRKASLGPKTARPLHKMPSIGEP